MGKTVTTYLVDSDPQGTQYSFISNKICLMFTVPRSHLSYLNHQKKLQKPAFYILLGEDESGYPQAYIGETENFKERVKDHDNKKDFWQKAIIFVSKDADMTKADVQYLEYKALEAAKKAKTFQLPENKQSPNAPNLPEHQQDAMDEFFEDIKFLASFIGCNIFEVSTIKKEHLFFLNKKECPCQGFYHSSGFTVKTGSIITSEIYSSMKWNDKRNKLLQQYAHSHEKGYQLHTDITFKSPSTASEFCLGRSSNGWKEWQDKDDKTLDEIYRHKLS